MIRVGGDLYLPRGQTKNATPLKIELQEIVQAECRLGDLAIVNQLSAKEYMAVMNKASHLAYNYLGEISVELIYAQREYDTRRAIVITEIMPKKLEEMKVKGNEDYREAILAKDEEFANIKDRVECLKAAHILLENKIKTFVRAFNAARSVLEQKSGSILPDTNHSFNVSRDRAGHSIDVGTFNYEDEK